MGCQFSANRCAPPSSGILTSLPFPIPGIPISIDRRSEGLLMENDRRGSQRRRTKRGQGQVKRIDVLPDDILLEIFDLCRQTSSYRGKPSTKEWQSLVHVCRRWRNLIFASPRRLNLQVLCSPKTRARDALDVWPALPLIVEGDMYSSSRSTDNVVATLGHSDRVCQISLWNLSRRQLEEVLATMQVPFPELTELRLFSKFSFGESQSVIPDSFLAGSAPRLRHFELDGISFPGLPNLLFSAANLVHLWLRNMPHSGYFSLEAIVALLSVLSRLETLTLVFHCPRYHLGRDRETQHPAPLERSVVPALRSLRFRGVIEYLEDLVTFIDAPQLVKIEATFFNQIDFDVPRLAQFIDRTPKLTNPIAQLQFYDYIALIGLSSAFGAVEIKILSREPNWQLSFVEEVCNSSFHTLSTVEDLYIEHRYLVLVRKVNANENILWLQLLLPFTAVKNLYLSKEFAPDIAAALQEFVGNRIIEVLPNLQNIFVEGLESSGRFQENIGQFAAGRLLSNHPIVISDWDQGC